MTSHLYLTNLKAQRAFLNDFQIDVDVDLSEFSTSFLRFLSLWTKDNWNLLNLLTLHECIPVRMCKSFICIFSTKKYGLRFFSNFWRSKCVQCVLGIISVWSGYISKCLYSKNQRRKILTKLFLFSIYTILLSYPISTFVLWLGIFAEKCILRN